jgi:Flp pilus assembly protein TadG
MENAIQGRLGASILWLLTSFRRLPGRRAAGRVEPNEPVNRARSEEGSTLVELALTIPVLLTFVFGWMQVCMAISTRSLLSEIAREGTRYAMVRGATCVNVAGSSCMATAANVNAYLNGVNWPNVGGSVIAVSTTYPDGNENAGSRVQVTVTNVFPFNIPFVSRTSLTMSSTSVMYILQ